MPQIDREHQRRDEQAEEQRLTELVRAKEQGARMLRAREYAAALELMQAAVASPTPQQSALASRVLADIHFTMAECHLELKDFVACATAAQNSLMQRPSARAEQLLRRAFAAAAQEELARGEQRATENVADASTVAAAAHVGVAAAAASSGSSVPLTRESLLVAWEEARERERWAAVRDATEWLVNPKTSEKGATARAALKFIHALESSPFLAWNPWLWYQLACHFCPDVKVPVFGELFDQVSCLTAALKLAPRDELVWQLLSGHLSGTSNTASHRLYALGRAPMYATITVDGKVYTSRDCMRMSNAARRRDNVIRGWEGDMMEWLLWGPSSVCLPEPSLEIAASRPRPIAPSAADARVPTRVVSWWTIHHSCYAMGRCPICEERRFGDENQNVFLNARTGAAHIGVRFYAEHDPTSASGATQANPSLRDLAPKQNSATEGFLVCLPCWTTRRDMIPQPCGTAPLPPERNDGDLISVFKRMMAEDDMMTWDMMPPDD
jgi:hypothetical protein